jgi:glycosyltransferase involved in cell wall biosynthesis
MRVLVLGDLSSSHTVRWLEALAAHHEVVGAGFGEPTARVEQVRWGPSPAPDLAFVRAAARLRTLVSRVQPEVIHAHYVSSYGVLALLAGGGAPVVQFAWGTDVLGLSGQRLAQRRLTVRALQRAAQVFADSEEVSAAARSVAPATPVGRAVFGPERSWTTAPRTPAKVVLSPRSLRPVYNIDVVLAAHRAAAASVPGWTLEQLTGGQDPEEHGLASTHDDVRFLPRLSVDELHQANLRAEVVCSVPSSDGTSVSLLEAMASGCFPIVSDLPANREWVRHEDNGLIVPVRDEGALTAALVRALGDTELRDRARDQNRARIAQDATWEVAVDRVLAATAAVARR